MKLISSLLRLIGEHVNKILGLYVTKMCHCFINGDFVFKKKIAVLDQFNVYIYLWFDLV